MAARHGASGSPPVSPRSSCSACWASSWAMRCASRRSSCCSLLGLLAGPVLGLVDPDALLGDALFPLVSMAVGLLLFEESLKLDFRRLHGGARRPVLGLVTAGAVVTGRRRHRARPAGVRPAVQPGGGDRRDPHRVRPDRRRAAARGDPAEAAARVGAGVRGHLHRPDRRHGRARAWSTSRCTSSGAGLGTDGLSWASSPACVAAAAVPGGRPVRARPASTHVALGVAVALAAFAAAEAVGEESGLWATTTLGVALANQTVGARSEALHEFGSHVGDAPDRLAVHRPVGPRSTSTRSSGTRPATLVLLALLVLGVRPLAAGLATIRTVLSRRERGDGRLDGAARHRRGVHRERLRVAVR